MVLLLLIARFLDPAPDFATLPPFPDRVTIHAPPLAAYCNGIVHKRCLYPTAPVGESIVGEVGSSGVVCLATTPDL